MQRKIETLGLLKSLEEAFRRTDSRGSLRSVFVELSPEQMQILRLMAGGDSARQIASRLEISEQTIRTYRVKVLERARGRAVRQIAAQRNTRRRIVWSYRGKQVLRPPFNAEYILYLLLRKEEREVAIGDMIEEYSQVLERFNKRRADIWFYKQVAGSILPLLRQALLRIGALVWLGRILRRLVS
jgi:DNA-binding CsgD family transcriptional regulator